MVDSRFGAINIKENMDIRRLSSTKKGESYRKFKKMIRENGGMWGEHKSQLKKRVPNLQSWNNMSRNIR